MTTKQAAAVLGLSPITIRRAIANGTLRARKVGRDWHITPAAVEAYRATSLGQPGRRVLPAPRQPPAARRPQAEGGVT